MKKIFALAAVLALAVSSTATAATLKSTPAANGTSAIYLNGEAAVFDTISVSLESTVGDFQAQDGGFNGFFPRAAGEPFSFINALLGAPVAQGGKGLTVVGAENTPDKLAFDATLLGGNITTGGDLFLANVLFPMPNVGVANVSLIAGGQVIQTLSVPINIPEPATIAMGGLGLIGVVAASRRRKA